MNVRDTRQWPKERSDKRFKQDLLIAMCTKLEHSMSVNQRQIFVRDIVSVANQIVELTNE
jgi:hypothetical protein